jgi:hypothetical protein
MSMMSGWFAKKGQNAVFPIPDMEEALVSGVTRTSTIPARATRPTLVSTRPMIVPRSRVIMRPRPQYISWWSLPEDVRQRLVTRGPRGLRGRREALFQYFSPAELGVGSFGPGAPDTGGMGVPADVAADIRRRRLMAMAEGEQF